MTGDRSPLCYTMRSNFNKAVTRSPHFKEVNESWDLLVTGRTADRYRQTDHTKRNKLANWTVRNLHVTLAALFNLSGCRV